MRKTTGELSDVHRYENETVDITQKIDVLRTTFEVKNALRKSNIIASSNNERIKPSLKDIFIISPLCGELSAIGECYSEIISEGHVYKTRCPRKYLALAVPGPGPLFEKEFAKFLDSPDIWGGRHQFKGVFLISFENWDRADDFIGHTAYAKFIKFIWDNREYMSYIFHVTPNFKNREMLINELGRTLNLCVVEHKAPTIEEASEYVLQQLHESGLTLDEGAEEEITNLIEAKINFESSDYEGFDTLDRLTASLQFELYKGDPSGKSHRESQKPAAVKRGTPPRDFSQGIIGRTDIKEVADMITGVGIGSNTRPIGFH